MSGDSSSTRATVAAGLREDAARSLTCQWRANWWNLRSRHLRHWFFSQLDRQIMDLMVADDLLLDPEGQMSRRAMECKFAAGSSTNYSMAGTLVSLVGDPTGAYFGQNRNDPFIQHHTPTYRELLGRN